MASRIPQAMFIADNSPLRFCRVFTILSRFYNSSELNSLITGLMLQTIQSATNRVGRAINFWL